MTNETNRKKTEVVARINDDNGQEYDASDIPMDSPDPNIGETDNPNIYIYWLDSDSTTLLTTEQTDGLVDGTLFCSPALAIRPLSLSDPEKFQNTWIELDKLYANPNMPVDTGSFETVPAHQFLNEVAEKINFYRRQNMSRSPDMAWTIPPDCPMGDELMIECLLPWTPEIILTNPNLLLGSDPWPSAKVQPYMLMPLVMGRGWVNNLSRRAMTFYADQLGIDVEKVVLERNEGLRFHIR